MIREFVPAGWESPFFGWTLDIDWEKERQQSVVSVLFLILMTRILPMSL